MKINAVVCVWRIEDTNSSAMVELLVMGFNLNTRDMLWGERGLETWDDFGCVDGYTKGHHHFSFFFSLLQVGSSIPRRKRMNNPSWNNIVSSAAMGIFILSPEVLIFSNWVLIHGNLLSFFFNFTPGSIAIGSLDFRVIYKSPWFQI